MPFKSSPSDRKESVVQVHIRLSLVLLLMLLPTSGVTQQTQGQITNGKERVVEKVWRKPTPFKIKNIKTKKGEFLIGQKLVDEDDWFNGLSVVLENVSGKTITYLGAGFLFPGQSGEGEKSPPLYKSLSYGHHPGAPGEAVLNIQPLALKPGEKFTVTLSEVDYDEVITNLKRLEYSQSIKAIKFHLMEIYFSDGTGWAGGTWLDRYREDRNSTIQEQPGSFAPRSPPAIINSSFLNPAMFSKLLYTKTSWQEICTVQSEPPHGSIGPCGVYDGFYPRRCCPECCPTFPSNCYKREAWIRPGYLGETFDTAVIEVRDSCRFQFGYGEACMLSPNRMHIPCGDGEGDPDYYGQYYVPEGNNYCDCSDDIDNNFDGLPDFDDWNCLGSPILVDVAGNNFTLTNGAAGVWFDLNGDGRVERLAWTAANADDAWLTLDRNSTGTVRISLDPPSKQV